jgi:hypothetical protein
MGESERSAELAEEVPRRRRRRSRSQRRSNQKLRFAYFTMASIWGFLSGTAGVLFWLTASGKPVRFEPIVLGTLAAAAAVAIVGGLVAAKAYREAAQRA